MVHPSVPLSSRLFFLILSAPTDPACVGNPFFPPSTCSCVFLSRASTFTGTRTATLFVVSLALLPSPAHERLRCLSRFEYIHKSTVVVTSLCLPRPIVPNKRSTMRGRGKLRAQPEAGHEEKAARKRARQEGMGRLFKKHHQQVERGGKGARICVCLS